MFLIIWKRRRGTRPWLPQPPYPLRAAEPGAGLDRKARRRMEAEIRQKKTRLLRPLQEKLELLEEEIARLETEKTEILLNGTSGRGG